MSLCPHPTSGKSSEIPEAAIFYAAIPISDSSIFQLKNEVFGAGKERNQRKYPIPLAATVEAAILYGNQPVHFRFFFLPQVGRHLVRQRTHQSIYGSSFCHAGSRHFVRQPTSPISGMDLLLAMGAAATLAPPGGEIEQRRLFFCARVLLPGRPGIGSWASIDCLAVNLG